MGSFQFCIIYIYSAVAFKKLCSGGACVGGSVGWGSAFGSGQDLTAGEFGGLSDPNSSIQPEKTCQGPQFVSSRTKVCVPDSWTSALLESSSFRSGDQT